MKFSGFLEKPGITVLYDTKNNRENISVNPKSFAVPSFFQQEAIVRPQKRVMQGRNHEIGLKCH